MVQAMSIEPRQDVWQGVARLTGRLDGFAGRDIEGRSMTLPCLRTQRIFQRRL
jgi:hypothetical protein